MRILWILKIWRLLQKLRKKKLSESFLLTQWNAIRNDNTSSQKVLFFFYFFFRCHFTVKNKFVIILRKLKIYWAYLIIQMTNRLLDGKVTNILLFVLTLFLSSCYFLTNKNYNNNSPYKSALKISFSSLSLSSVESKHSPV